MLSIGLNVEPIVQNVNAGRTEAERDERERRGQNAMRFETIELVGEDQRQENQNVLHPLMWTRNFQDRLDD